jgi:hypothetical protein
MRLTTSSTAILSAVKEFSKKTRKVNGKAYNGFITFDVCEETETMTITATDGSVCLNETLYILHVDGSFKFKAHIKSLMYTLEMMAEMPINIFSKNGLIVFDVMLNMGMLIEDN